MCITDLSEEECGGKIDAGAARENVDGRQDGAIHRCEQVKQLLFHVYRSDQAETHAAQRTFIGALQSKWKRIIVQ